MLLREYVGVGSVFRDGKRLGWQGSIANRPPPYLTAPAVKPRTIWRWAGEGVALTMPARDALSQAGR